MLKMTYLRSTLLALGAVLMAAILYGVIPFFLAGGDFHVPYLITYVMLVILPAPFIFYLAFWRPDYLLSRMKIASGDQPFGDKIFLALFSVVFYGGFYASAYLADGDFETVPLLLGVCLFALGLGIFAAAMFQNAFSSLVVIKHEGQRVVSDGLYRHVRHPMYLAALIVFPGWALIVQQWIFSLTMGVLCAMFLWRIGYEERFLEKNLKGYADYKKRVPWRVFPYIY